MPSKPKKHSKTPSKLSNSDQSASPSTPLSSSNTQLPESEYDEQDLLRSLEEASLKFPALIAKSAFVGRITDVDPMSKGCRIWLSESAMVASSLVPGSIVSVSLALSRNKFLTGFPLESFRDGCSRNFEIGVCDSRPDKVGNYFALAMVFPSCKVLKNGVRLSWNLSSTISSPALGRIIFVFPIQTRSLTGIVDDTEKFHRPTSPVVPCLSVYNCQELYLELVAAKNGLTVNHDVSSSVILQEVTGHGQFEGGKVLSPTTQLLSKPKLNSPVTDELRSGCEESVSSFCNSTETSFDAFDIRKVLTDEKSKELLQTCATSWLHNRCLLNGNLVCIPILSQLCVFCVKGTNKLSVECSNLGLKDKEIHDSFTQKNKSLEHVNKAFVVDNATKVNLSLSSSSALGPQCERGLPLVDLGSGEIKAKLASDVPKLGGLHKEFSLLKEIIISSSVRNSLSSLGLRTTKGVLLHGPPGTGKTSLARSCALDAGVNLFPLNGPEIVSQYYGESEKALHDVFDSACRAAPAVVFIDELDAIAPARKDGSEELSQRMVATLLSLMDGINRTNGLLVIAATNRPDSIDPALRRPGRLDREIEIGVPSPKQRLDILHTILSEINHSLVDIQVQHLASGTHGFVGADLAALCNEAALVCLRRYVKFKKFHSYSAVTCNDSSSNSASLMFDGSADSITEDSNSSCVIGDPISSNHLDSASSSLPDLTLSSENSPSVSLVSTAQKSSDTSENAVFINGTDKDCTTGKEFILKVTFEDFEKAKMKIRPSAMREVILEVPKVRWEDVGGQTEVKKQLMEAVQWPQKHQDAFKRIGTRPPTGLLMFGPPGCSKTLMARAVASEAGLNFLAVKGPELFSKWVGESEKAVRSLFSKARANAPSIVFFDEIDGLAVIRGKENDGASVADRVMSQLLVELDGLHQRVDVTVIAATNRPDKIDPALLRPGRFDRLLYVGPPSEIDRKDIFQIHLHKMPCSSDVCIGELAHLTEGYTGADIALICREAAVAAIEENHDASQITMTHLKTAIGQVQPSEIESCQDFSAKFQRLVCTTAARDDVQHQPCPSTHWWTPLWSQMKLLVMSFFQLSAALVRSKASS